MSEIRKFDWGAVSGGTTKPKAKTESTGEQKSRFYPRARAHLNRIPSPDELSRKINEALNALSKGVYWDRGSIVNIVL